MRQNAVSPGDKKLPSKQYLNWLRNRGFGVTILVEAISGAFKI